MQQVTDFFQAYPAVMILVAALVIVLVASSGNSRYKISSEYKEKVADDELGELIEIEKEKDR